MTRTVETGGKERVSLGHGAVLRFAPHAKFRFDDVRQAWIVLAPERLLLPDEQAVEILRLIDGQRAIDDVIDELARRYEASREIIAGDVVAMLQDLVDKKVLRC
jgi:pyrroloquinoline quinone biosynthesis protein D